MNKIKKILCLIFVTLMFFAVSVSATASNDTTTDSPLKIEITTDKSEYKVTNVAKITATVTNTGKEDLQNVSAEAVFTDLSPVSKKKSETKKEVETLKSGESISFTYKATLNKNEHKLNVFQKILLWFVRLFNGGYTPSDNGFDNGRDFIDKTDTLSFGKFDAVNTVRVWYGGNGNTTTVTDEEKAQEGFTEYFSIKKEINNIEEKYKTDNGYILEKDVENVINEIANYAEQKKQQDYIKEYSAEIENNCVTITLKSGIEIIYMPNIEGVDSVDISSYQPCLFTYSADIQEKSRIATDGSAEEIQRQIKDYKFVNNYDNADITLDRLKNIGDNEIIIWHGHGGYDTKHHSYLMTNIKLDEAQFLLNPIYYITKIGYTDDYLSGRILCSSNGYVLVTYKFFEHYLNNLNNSFIYLGACSSGKDSTLANVFISKGASAVVGNTDTIHTNYNLDMLESICKKMTNINSDSNKYYTLNEALNFAKEKNGSICCSEYPNTEVRTWGNSNYRFSDKTVFAGGDGTEENPYQVATPEQLNAVRNDLSAHYIQIADIDMADWGNWEPIGSQEYPFNGTFTGNNYTISNLFIKKYDINNSACIGLFGCANNLLQHINLSNISYEINGQSETPMCSEIGGIVGYFTNTVRSVKNCFVDGHINVQWKGDLDIGGIVGNGRVEKSKNYSEITINGTDAASINCGGISGESKYIKNCTNNGNIFALSGGGITIGGICGHGHGNIVNCVNFGNINATSNTALNYPGYATYSECCNIGGIAGWAYDSINNCINYGNLIAKATGTTARFAKVTSAAGGIVGNYHFGGTLSKVYGTMENCYNISYYIEANNEPINSNASNGITNRITNQNSPYIKNCFSLDSTQINGKLITSIDSSNSNGADLERLALLKEETYKDFDFENTWIIDPEIGGAILR